MELHSQYTSKYRCVLRLQQIFCSWGGKRPFSVVDPKHTNSSIGNTAPLWKNKNKKLYFIFFVLNLCSAFLALILFLTMVLGGSSSKSSDTSSTTPLTDTSATTLTDATTSNNSSSNTTSYCRYKNDTLLRPEFNFIGFSIFMANSVMSRYLSLLEYASDQEWSRYTIINLSLWSSLMGYNVFEYYQFVQGFKKKNNDNCRVVFLITLWSKFVNMIVTTVVAVYQLFSLIKNYCKLFSGKGVLKEDRTPYTRAVELKVINDI